MLAVWASEGWNFYVFELIQSLNDGLRSLYYEYLLSPEWDAY